MGNASVAVWPHAHAHAHHGLWHVCQMRMCMPRGGVLNGILHVCVHLKTGALEGRVMGLGSRAVTFTHLFVKTEISCVFVLLRQILFDYPFSLQKVSPVETFAAGLKAHFLKK